MAVPAFLLVPLGLIFSALSLLTIGLPFLAGVLALARGTIRWFRLPARRLLGWNWSPPEKVAWNRPASEKVAWNRPASEKGDKSGSRRITLRPLITDPAAWKALAYNLLTLPVKAIGAYLGGPALLIGLTFVLYPLWQPIAPKGLIDDAPWWLALQGLAVFLTAPWFVRLMVHTDRFLAYALLTPSRSSQRIAALEAGRAALQSDAAALLKRIERDLHDGTQARLVALGVTLSRIARRAETDDSRELARNAQQAVTEALTELRDIVRGLHPPALDDGLEVALASLAARSAVPARVTVHLSTRPPDATASAIYFTAAELLTNVAKHAKATRIAIDLHDLTLAVRDNGRGGARLDTPGTGLSGLARRAEALDGELTIDSPPGGPTTVTVTFGGL